LIPQSTGASLPLRDDERLLAQLAGAMFSALPSAGNPAPPLPGQRGVEEVAAPVTAPGDPQPIRHAHLPAADIPAMLTPPPLGGVGRPVQSPHVSELFRVDRHAGAEARSVDLLPASLASPAFDGRGIDAIRFEDGDRLYFLKDGARPDSDRNGGSPFEQAPDVTPALPHSPAAGFYDVELARRDFPILQERVGGKPLVWLDNGATTQKPRAVIDRLSFFYEHENSNIHRAAHELAARSTDAYEGARDTVARFIGAPSSDTIVFTRGTTESINLVAQSWGRQNLGKGDSIILSNLEHHANIVPWVRLSEELGFTIRVAPVDDRGDIIVEEYARLLDGSVRLAAFTQVSNALGSVTPAKLMTELAHAAGAFVLIDGAQSVSHMPVDVQALDPDFFVFSGHKIYGPTGIGVLYGRKELLDAIPPWQGGGNMIEDVTFDHIRYHDAPMKFEAGTGNIADAVGLGAALDYVLAIGREAICAHEHMLISYTQHQLEQIPGVRLIGDPMERAGVISFVMEKCDVPEIGQALSREGIAVRAGHHCAQPILRRMGVEATVRPSFGLYNTQEDVDALIRVLRAI